MEQNCGIKKYGYALHCISGAFVGISIAAFVIPERLDCYVQKEQEF
jgi:hypothetical protein